MFQPLITRRKFMAGTAALTSWAYVPRQLSAAGTKDPRFLFLNLRGGMDGLALLAPVGDPDYAAVRRELAMPISGKHAGVRLDDTFMLNPNLPYLAKLWSKSEATLFHATATSYRKRSHFDAQDVLESGHVMPGFNRSGWLNRMLSDMPRGEPVSGPNGLALGTSIPLVLRGPNKVINWMPAGFKEVKPALAEQLLNLYNHTDPDLARVMAEGINLRDMAGGEKAMTSDISMSMESMDGKKSRGAAKHFRYMGVAAGKLLARPDGPRIAAMSLTGWDTHHAEGPINGKMGRLLGALDSTIEGIHGELKDVWDETVVIIATEFGRTVKMNGTKGTDHGTATTAIAIGGALKGGQVVADWPGLSQSALYEGRDLQPTTDLRAILKGVISEHLGVDERILADSVFPDSQDVKPLRGLIS